MDLHVKVSSLSLSLYLGKLLYLTSWGQEVCVGFHSGPITD